MLKQTFIREIITVMEDIAPWYDKVVQYVGEHRSIPRCGSSKQLLQSIEEADLIMFDEEGRRVRMVR